MDVELLNGLAAICDQHQLDVDTLSSVENMKVSFTCGLNFTGC